MQIVQTVLNSPLTLIEQDLDFEPYLDMIQIKKFRRAFTCFRISAHNIMIEKGRYIGVSQE